MVCLFLIIMVSLLYIEVKQLMTTENKSDYFWNLMNWLQNIVLILNISIGLFRLLKSATIPENWSSLSDSEYTFFVVVAPSVSMFLSSLEFMYILTYWRSFSFYVRMIS